MELVKSKTNLSPAAIRDVLLENIQNFVGTAPQHDDLTMVILRFL